MNQVIISGRIVKDAELRYAATGTAVYNNTVAVEDGFGDNKKTYFIDFVAFQKTAENAAQWTFKGQRVIVQGKMVKRSYDSNDGKKTWITEVHADRIEYTDFKDSKQSNSVPTLSDSDLPF